MKKLLILSLILGSIAVAVPEAEAAVVAGAAVAAPQIRVQVGPQRSRRVINRHMRSRTYTRIVNAGRNRFRETVRVIYMPNGRTRTQVLSRVRIGRAW